MTPSVTRRRGSRTAPTRETLQGIHDFVVRRTLLLKESGLRIVWQNLDEGEIAELVELTRQAEEGQGGFNLGNLSKRKAGRWEALVARGAGEAEGFFEDRRQAAAIAQLAREAHRSAVRRPISRHEELGLFEAFAKQLGATPPNLFADHAAVAFFVLLQLHSGVPFAARSSVERDPDGTPFLRVDSSYGLLGDRDPYGVFANWKAALAQLQANSWFIVTKTGSEWVIRPGSRAKRAMAGTVAKKKTAA